MNPALVQFLAEIGEQFVVAQLLIERQGPEAFLLRHAEDAGESLANLQPVPLENLRERTQHNALGIFRPLRSSPDLIRGWYCRVESAAELELALDYLYPGFLADWFAVRTGTAAPTDYPAFTQRQSGMYRLTAKATPEQAAAIIQACCARPFCLKQRLWTVPGMSADRVEDKSIIPCLEPCAVLLEFARKRMRIAQETPAQLALAPTEIRGLLAAVENCLNHPDANLRVADFNAPTNPRHLLYVQQKLMSALPKGSAASSSTEAREEE
ncbi:DR2241 family protein [Fontisphaera persica]|uniref:DR2241 family protein n=1 Tax=Fontisphaera persica TaxID=2974023 RepID=UPI0024BF2913|nr:DR2241 family protein [Fontisphaera persica]WCJ60873.1 DR2241 family protein [Fontisphaera persica]